ncbi:TetR/AcrR family transcriptional regulator [Methylobacterium brachythecii]|uniref:AcrR family transcriptional regulator n=1 Tax=Methylobacterium brachythecii TaxID=1176177 RepID=A0A7W6ALC6_9HYPH|nr:TetR/AcrR family transcriptional regulator [Methylobacterium brachythecii]MBB3905545.1 AcrR family transcriptional regulator [Methylobacterium brachythecii]GLS46274.1 TetR family transcriptional regulator [Methylobacterium brachythecii]
MVMGRPRSFCTDKALDEAMEVFWRHGYDGSSLAMLTKAMGIKPPSLYAAFGSKEGLLKAALDRYAQKRSEHMRYVLAGKTARDVAERFLSSIAESHTDPANPPGCLLVQGGLACGEGSESIPFELAAKRAETERDLKERFVLAKQTGDLSKESDPSALARFLSTVASGMGVLASSGADREALRDVARVSIHAFSSNALS